jgi:phage terminase small subunit
MKSCTPLELDFIACYLECGYNAAEAIRRSGYKCGPRKARCYGYRILQRPHVKAEIAKHTADVGLTAAEVLGLLRTRAEMDPGVFEDILRDAGNNPAELLKLARQAGVSQLIKGVSYDRSGKLKVELIDSGKALELLAKHHRLLVDRVSIDRGDIEAVVAEVVRVVQAEVDDPEVLARISAGISAAAKGME